LTKKYCTITDCDSIKLFQEYWKGGHIFRLYRIDDGAFGHTVVLKVCSCHKNELIEEIGLRGDDYFPTLDSVVGRDVYLHYSFLRKESDIKIEDIAFDSVVLGEALLRRTKLKYNYVFKNIIGE